VTGTKKNGERLTFLFCFDFDFVLVSSFFNLDVCV
jgi:hypothetical protein